jgi:hypothetical protein
VVWNSLIGRALSFVEDSAPPQLLEDPSFSEYEVIEQALDRLVQWELPVAAARQETIPFESTNKNR